MKLDIVDALNRIEQYRQLNRPELEDLEFYHDGAKIEIPPNQLREFIFLGLNNTDFIRWYFGKEEFFTSLMIYKKGEDQPGDESIDSWMEKKHGGKNGDGGEDASHRSTGASTSSNVQDVE